MDRSLDPSLSPSLPLSRSVYLFLVGPAQLERDPFDSSFFSVFWRTTFSTGMDLAEISGGSINISCSGQQIE